MEEHIETYEEMISRLKTEWKETKRKEAEKGYRARRIRNPIFWFIARVILFPICLLIRLFRWTYYYD